MGNRNGLSPLSEAVYFEKVTEVQRLLAQGENWQTKVQWAVSTGYASRVNQSILTLSALELAACLNNREIVLLILSHADLTNDKKLIQDAYDIACQFKQADVFICFS